MDEERLRNFKELQAKFQKLDVPSLPGPIQFPASVSHKGDFGSTQSTRTWANGKPLSSHHDQPPPYCSAGEPQPRKAPKMKPAQRSEIQEWFDSPGPPGRFAYPAVNSQKAPLLLDVNQANAKITNEKKSVVTSSFRNKLWNWEKVSSQNSEMSSAFRLADCGGRAFHPEDQQSTGLTTPEGPRQKLQIKGSQTLPSQRYLMAQRESWAKKITSEDPTFLLSPHGRKSLEKSHPERCPAGSTSQPIYERELARWPPEKQLDVKHHQLPKTKPLPSVESLGPPPTKPPKPPAVNLQAFQRQTAAFPKTHREAAVKEGYLPPESAEFEEPHNYEATISYLRHSGNSINLCTAEEIADCKSTKPINSVTSYGMKMCQKWYFPSAHYKFKHSHPCCFAV
uniref:Uncharacterized protein n=1 Tax=Desmodus rotundus TaxID=9430 RepID=K9IJA9_DESRO